MNDKLNVLINAKKILEMTEDVNNRDVIRKFGERTDIRVISKCWEIADCTSEIRKGCKNFNSTRSCWLSFNKCTCSHQPAKSCETCHIYQWHMREIKLIDTRVTKKNAIKVALFLEHLNPVFERFLKNENNLNFKLRRRKRILKLIALQALEALESFKHISMEKYLNRVYEKMLWG
jgi:hypothetical protein